MFSRAGLDLRRARVILIYARVSVREGRRTGWANLLRFRSGDLAWYCKNPEFLCWGLRMHFNDHHSLWVPFGWTRDLARSSVDCPDALAWRAKHRPQRRTA